jgi:hypothetical protein
MEVEQPLHYQTACGSRMQTPAGFLITGFPKTVALHWLYRYKPCLKSTNAIVCR